MGTPRDGSGGSPLGDCLSVPWFVACAFQGRDIRYDALYVEKASDAHISPDTLYLVTLSPISPPALSLSTLIWRYVRQFVKMDAREALQYVYCVCLSADQGNDVGKEQVESAWDLVRRIIVLANTGAAWEELVGGFRADGTRFVRLGIITSRWSN